MSHRNRRLSACLAAILLAACSGGNAPPPPVDPAVAAKSAQEAKAAAQFRLYEQMRTSGSFDLAAPLGEELIKTYPGTAAAVRVQQTIAEVRSKADAQRESRRLSRLWAYNAVPEAGGTQYTAAIASKDPLPGAGARIRLVLRQHPKWGQSVYLLLDNATFDCSKGCATLPVSFDGAPAQRMKATIPPGGEPALFIDDDKGFIAKLEKSKTVAIDVTIKGVGPKSEVFEVGGYDATKLPEKPKK
ncbi:MAG TPA: hypothetical protein VFB32_00200 [Rudaea sp.]|nr:hypothetical protein [Rudaea sp.]